MFSAQYQQRPVPLEGNLIRRDWFRFYDELPQAVPAGWIAQSWDIATMTGEANDFSVCTTWRMIRGDYYLVDVFRDRLQYPDLRRKIASLAVQYGAQTVLIENAGPGLTLLQDLHHTPRPACPTRSTKNRTAAKPTGWWPNRPRSKRDTSACLETPIGSTVSCSSRLPFRMADTTTKSIASRNS